MMENLICRAQIHAAGRKLPMLFWYLLCCILFLCGGVPVTRSYLYTTCVHRRIFFITVYSERIHSDGYTFGYLWKLHLLLAACICLAVLMLPLICCGYRRRIAAGCSLLLTDTQLTGRRQYLFHAAELRLLHREIRDAAVSEKLGDRLFGGKTVIIRSVSGTVKFRNVQNADAMVQAINEKI